MLLVSSRRKDFVYEGMSNIEIEQRLDNDPAEFGAARDHAWSTLDVALGFKQPCLWSFTTAQNKPSEFSRLAKRGFRKIIRAA